MVSDGEIARFYATIGADTSGLTRGVAQARSQLAGLQGSAGQAGGAFRSLAAGFGVGLGIVGITAVTRALSDGMRASMSYETAFVGVRRTVDATDAQFASLDATIRRMATGAIPLGRDALAGIATIGGQMNVPISQMEKFIDTVAKVSVASNGVLSPEAAAASLGKLAPQMRIPLGSIDKLASAVAKGADVGLANEAEVYDIALRSANAQRIAGFTPAQTLALAATGPKLGNPEEVGTAFAMLPMQLSKIVQAGGDDLEALSIISGVTSQEFKRQWETDAFGAFRRFTEGVGRLGEGVFPTLEEMGLGGARVGKVVLGLAGDPTEIDKQLASAKEQLASGAYLADEAALAFDTAHNKIQLFKSSATEAGEAIVGPFLDGLIGTLPTLTLFMDQLARGFGTGGIVSSAFALDSPEPSVGKKYPDGWAGVIPKLRDLTQPSHVLGGLLDAGNEFGGALFGGSTGPQTRTIGGDLLSPGRPALTATELIAREAERNRLSKIAWGSDDGAGYGDAADFGTMGSGIATEGPQVKGAISPEAAAEQRRLNAIYAGRGAVAKVSDEQKALNEVEEAHTRQLVEAYIKGGDKRVAIVRAEQARLDQAWSGIAAGIHNLGVAVPEEFRLMWEESQKALKDKGKDTLSGLLGFLAARDTQHGANPLTGKFAVRGADGEMVGPTAGGGPTIVVEGDVNFGLRPDIPGGIDADAGFTVLATKDFKDVGR